MIREYTCPMPHCKSHKGFKLMADYSSSGLWCQACGVGFMNPKDEFPDLPPGLIDLIEAWNMYWDYFASEKSKYNYEFHRDVYLSAGKYLANLMNLYYPCSFKHVEPPDKKD